jgi:hemoglobin
VLIFADVSNTNVCFTYALTLKGFNSIMNTKSCEYGVGDNSYNMAGKLAGITELVDAFYNNMDAISDAQKIRNMHSTDLYESRKKLCYFLSGWLGGPKLYAQHYGSINIPLAHKHLSIGIEESEAWLLCMQKAVDKQPYEQPFKSYLMEQLRVPANRIKMLSGT